MNIFIRHSKEYVNLQTGVKSVLSRQIQSQDIIEVFDLYCVDDISFSTHNCGHFNYCSDCWLNELEKYHKTYNKRTNNLTIELKEQCVKLVPKEQNYEQ